MRADDSHYLIDYMTDYSDSCNTRVAGGPGAKTALQTNEILDRISPGADRSQIEMVRRHIQIKFSSGDSHLSPPFVLGTWDEGKGHSRLAGWH
jgi:hypothetical protein